jgi:hypothetical protein
VEGKVLPVTVNVGASAWREIANRRTVRVANLRAREFRRERGSANAATASKKEPEDMGISCA